MTLYIQLAFKIAYFLQVIDSINYVVFVKFDVQGKIG